MTAEAIRNAYLARLHLSQPPRGRPLLPSDFDTSLQQWQTP